MLGKQYVRLKMGFISTKGHSVLQKLLRVVQEHRTTENQVLSKVI